MRTHILTCLAVSVAAFASADQTWKPTAGGTYDWNAAGNWTSAVPGSDDAVTFGNAASGVQIITGTGGVVKSLDVNSSSQRREFASGLSLTAESAVFRAGVNRVYGDLTLTGGDSMVSRFGTSKSQGPIFDIYGTVDASGLHAFCVGRGNDLNTDAFGLIRLQDGATLKINTPGGSNQQTASVAGLLLGHCGGSSTASIIRSGYQQLGGTSVLGRLMVGFEKGAAASAVVKDGKMELHYINGTTRFRVGHKGYGLFKQLGGTVEAMLGNEQGVASDFDNAVFDLGSGSSIDEGLKGAAFYACGGTFTAGRDFMLQGNHAMERAASVPVAPVSATVEGAAVVDLRRLIVGGNQTSGRASVNLNEGGRLAAYLVTNKVARSGIGEISGNGGTLQIKSSTTERAQFVGLEYLNVYEKGLTLQCDAGVRIGDAETSAVLRTPDGYGVESIAVSTDQEYRYDPFVAIEGGSGSGATAVALLDYETRKVTNVVVTCRGEGYRADDQLTLKITSPSGLSTLANAVFTLTENKPGTFVKTGSKRLVVYNQPEFDGTYAVREGLMIQSSGQGSPKLAALEIGGGESEAQFQCASGGREETVVNMVNPEAELVLKGKAKLSVPKGLATVPNVQEFAKLTVEGTDNRIWTIDSEATSSRPIEVRFGALAFAKDSQLILKSNENFRVYAPLAMAGTYLKNVTFEGKEDQKIGFVAEDGQIVPRNGKGLIIILR